MLFKRSLYEELLQNTPPAPPESGGILGERNGAVIAFFVDAGLSDKTGYSTYCPNIALLNEQIEKWAETNIEFCGLYHTHLQGGISLSDADKEYIKIILITLRKESLYFPIIINGQIIVYRAYVINDCLYTERVAVELK